jgi:hypothetical protein
MVAGSFHALIRSAIPNTLVLHLSEVAAIIRRSMPEKILKAWDRIVVWVRGKRKPKPVEPAAPELLSLTPKYDREKHGVYFDVIETALTKGRKSIKNIALTGSYGVGKSSILEKVARQQKRHVISVSLSTLGFEDEPKPTTTAARTAATKTNRIQKEIVKQLLYSQDPVKMPGSRYRRITRFRLWRGLGFASLVAVPITVLFFLAGWTASIAVLVALPKDLALMIHVVVFVAATLLILGLRAIFHNKIQIDQISAGAATISLSAKSATYFDEYLDEIVYFFEVIKRDIVIFEDIDRFDDPHIFETLRSLNTILNGAKQLKGRDIRFIYAIKDSIFDELGARAAKEELEGEAKLAEDDAAEAEVARANRTKFFDLVIPVVPFITHRSARDLLAQTMKGLDHKVSADLIDLAARHVADMRLIKNIRNEFAIFKERVIDSGSLKLSQNRLFAMVLYKSTHLSDFELIKVGKSNLDDLYRDARALVASNIGSINTELRRARQGLRAAIMASALSKKLGDALSAHIALSLRQLVSARVQSLQMAGEALDEDALRTPAFWEKLAATDGTVIVGYYHPNYGGMTLSLSRSDISQALDEPINAQQWADERQESLRKEIAEATEKRAFLAHAEMSDLMSRSEFTAEYGGKQVSFEQLAQLRLKSDLAVQLLRAGYIDRNFTLYTSTFYTDRVSANATNFILKNVDPNEIDMYFDLSMKDAKAVVRETRRAVLHERAGYNVSLLNYLLKSDVAGAEIMIGELVKYSDEEREFLLAYLEGGKRKDRLVSAMTPLWSRIFLFLVSESDLDDATRANLVNVAVSSAPASYEYGVDESVRKYLVDHYEQLAVFTSTDTSDLTASVAAELVRKTRAKLPVLSTIGAPVLDAVVAVGGFEVSRDNLRTALGDPTHSLALDSIAASKDAVYRRTLQELSTYVAVLQSGEQSVEGNATFISTVEDVLQADTSQLAKIVELSAAHCIVESLADVSVEAWPVLAEFGRFPVSIKNVSAYMDEIALDGHLAAVLAAAGAITTEADDTEPDKLAVALAILSAVNEVPAPKLRSALAASLSLTAFIPASSIPNESGELVGYLIADKVVGDDAATFAVIKPADREGRAFAISRSTDFLTFMSPVEVTPQFLGFLMPSTLVPDNVKDAIVDRFSEFTVGATKNGLEHVANWAIQRNKALSLAETIRLATEGVRPAFVLPLLAPHLGLLSLAELAPVLLSLGGEYAKLSERNGKRPLIPLTNSDRVLVVRLKELQVVKTSSESTAGIRVNMKQRP